MIQVRNLNKTYDKGRHANQVLHDVSFDLPETGFVCILGASGCGKTSLLNAVGGLDTFQSGTLSAGDVSVTRYGARAFEAQRNRNFGYVFQNYYLLSDHSVGYNVYMGLHSLDLTHREKLKRVRAALQAVDMERYIRRNVSDLSGGQQQRIAIARALARQPRVIFADEPTGNLDEANTANICTLLRKISRTSLVVMVTHEAHIARFFADRIITLDQGRISQDSGSWTRGGLSTGADKALYTGDYEETKLEGEGLNLRLLREAGAAPVELTLLATKDRIILKLADGRAISCGNAGDEPVLKEGNRPQLTIETIDRSGGDMLTASFPPAKAARAGKGVSFSMMLSETRQLMKGKGLKKAGMRLFLVLLTVLTVLTVGDYITVSSINKESFITTHENMVEIHVSQGTTIRSGGSGLTASQREFAEYLTNSGLDFEVVPHVYPTAKYTISLFSQMEDVSIQLENFSYVPLDCFDESTLVSGRLPENANEIIVDRWVLDGALRADGILQNGIGDASYFLGCRLSYSKKDYAPTIVGICDSGNPAIYMDIAGLISLGSGGKEVMRLSELQAMYPGKFDDLSLASEECLLVEENVGNKHQTEVRFSGAIYLNVVGTVSAKDATASLVVADDQLENLLISMLTERYWLYCQDKQAVMDFLDLKGSDMERLGYVDVSYTDYYTDTLNAYTAAASLRADARTIVTFTIIALAMVMLYLLCRAQAQERIGMLAVYRLLGIPRRKLVCIFSLETVLSSLITALPAAIAAWGFANIATRITEIDFRMILPWYAALGVYGCILVYHLIVSLLPLRRLLRLPPAQLAAKYDM